MEIRTIKAKFELEAIFPILCELRPHLTFKQFLEIVSESAKRDDYELVAIFDGSKCVAVMGIRILYDFVHGKHLYIDDLVVTVSRRSMGLGARLLKFAEDIASKKQCNRLRLCTGTDNEGGKRFYEREGWRSRAVVFKKQCVSDVSS